MLLKEAGLHHTSRDEKENVGQTRGVVPDLGSRPSGRAGEAGLRVYRALCLKYPMC